MWQSSTYQFNYITIADWYRIQLKNCTKKTFSSNSRIHPTHLFLFCNFLIFQPMREKGAQRDVTQNHLGFSLAYVEQVVLFYLNWLKRTEQRQNTFCIQNQNVHVVALLKRNLLSRELMNLPIEKRQCCRWLVYKTTKAVVFFLRFYWVLLRLL